MSIGFKFVILIYSISAILCGIVLLFLIEDTKKICSEKINFSIKSISKILFMKKAWLIGIIIFCAFIVYTSLTYLSPYPTEVYIMPVTLVASLSIIRTYDIKVVASPIIGIITDKAGSCIKVMFVGFILMMVSIIAYLLMPVAQHFTWLAVGNMMVLSIVVFGFRGIYFASVEESNIPLESTGTVVGFASFIGFSPDAFYYTIVGSWLDNYGDRGYTYIFLVSIVCCIAGSFATYKLIKINAMERIERKK